MKIPISREDAWTFASEWIAAWNAHDLELILSHYDDAIDLTSSVAARLLQKPGGQVTRISNLRIYFQHGLKAYPQLHFELESVFCGLRSVVLCYRNQQGTRSAEFMEFSTSGKVVRVVANYSA